MFHMPDGGIEKNGVVVVSDYLFYCLIDRLLHQRVIFAITELTDYETTQVRQHTAHSQVAHHAVDMIMAFGDSFDEQDGE